ncbi:hypothetical protein [Aneurinibacillus tyrosinisolvens]|uniref:hypothetical protein n=1 Tax=Aneurinibacillus tyrosinisolvens TaxID=1443435 RepID=UPI000AA48AB5|nr:hypothetical protein [Aneurinibacillus tyrosinisolvens]
MVQEWSYRRQALQSWKNSKVATKAELSQDIKNMKNATKNPFVYFISSFIVWLLQQR